MTFEDLSKGVFVLLVNPEDFRGYDLSDINNPPVGVVCTVCKREYRYHFGNNTERAECNKYGSGQFFIPDLPLLRPRFELPEDLFEIGE